MIHCGDLFDVLPTLDDASIDACVTDPPYGIGFMGKEWDTFKPGSGMHRKLMHPRERELGKIVSDNPNLNGRWRSPALSPSQIDYDYSVVGLRGFQEWTQRWAAEVYRVMKPGAYIVVCCAPRSYHRMACGLEDAGFVIRDKFSWLFGSGFPKNLNLGDGKGTALKPGHEPIALAWKPFKGSITACHEQYGTAALNIDACRLDVGCGGYRGDEPSAKRRHADAGGTNFAMQPGPRGEAAVIAESLTLCAGSHEGSALGRWPSNVLLDEDAAAALDEMSGELTSGFGDTVSNDTHGDRGGASRFFYVAKPSRAERDMGCYGLSPRSAGDATDRQDGSAGLNSPRAGAGRTGGARNIHPCLPPGEMVLTDAGYRPIETIRVGDKVFAGSGLFEEVVDAFSSPCDGHIYTVGVDGTNQTTRATGNHPFLIWRPTRKRGSLVDGEVGWQSADRLAVGDYTLTPVSPGGEDAMSVDRAWAFGLWLAEGSFTRSGHGPNKYPVWSLHVNEESYVERLRRAFGDVRVYPHGERGIVAMVFDAALAVEFERLGGTGARTKRLSPDVLIFDDAARRAIVEGYFDGDGARVRQAWSAKTASADLAATFPLLAESVGLHVAAYFNDPCGVTLIAGREVQRRPYWHLYATNNPVRRRPRFIEHGGRRYSVRRIKSIGCVTYSGPVWNITVDREHTFQTKVGLTHNTVKPVELMRYLVRLVTPHGGVVLDPFTGSGTTGMACAYEGLQFVGIEREAEYVEIAERRIAACLPLLNGEVSA